jgi:acyl dehydratase
MLEITQLIPQHTTGIAILAVFVHNQRGELVLTGEQKYLVKKRSC